MSEYGHVNDDPATIMRLFTQSRDDRVVLKRTVRPYRQATRNRPSSVKRSFDPTIIHAPITSQAMFSLRQYGMGGSSQVGTGGGSQAIAGTSPRQRPVVVRGAGGGAGDGGRQHASKMTDFHRTGIQRTR